MENYNNNEELTIEEEKFCSLIALGEKKESAFKKAFKNKSSLRKDFINNDSYQLFNQKKIQDRIDVMISFHKNTINKVSFTGEKKAIKKFSYTKIDCLNEVNKEVLEYKKKMLEFGSYSARDYMVLLKAIDMKARLFGLYEEKSLQSIFGDNTTIKVNNEDLEKASLLIEAEIKSDS